MLYMLDIYALYAIMKHMIRTMVYLTKEQARDIKLQAKREQKHEAEVIRDLVNKGLTASRKSKPETTGEALLRLGIGQQ